MLPVRLAAKQLGVSTGTLRKWEAEGKLTSQRTPAGHRRYDVAALTAFAVEQSLIAERPSSVPSTNPSSASSVPVNGAIYCRVSSAKERGDLLRQKAFMQCQFPSFEIFLDIGSSTHYYRPGLRRLLERIMHGSINKVAASSKDRIGRCGFELFSQICELKGVELVFIESDDNSTQEELANDIVNIVRVFTSRSREPTDKGVNQSEEPHFEEASAASAANIQEMGGSKSQDL